MLKTVLRRIWLAIRLLGLALLVLLALPRSTIDDRTPSARVYGAVRGETFNYVEWEIDALWSKVWQSAFGYTDFIPPDQQNQLILKYFSLQNQLWTVEQQLQALEIDDPQREQHQADYDALQDELLTQRELVEPIIEYQVSAVLADEGFAFLGQVMPPVSMRFLDIPDVLVVSPREEIRQLFTVTLDPRNAAERVVFETDIADAVPDLSVWLTPIGGVGLFPSMVTETDRAVVAFEITAHEWAHHYLVFFPLGLEYFNADETRIINETTATILGNEVGNLVIERFYPDELAQGLVYLQPIPDYRSLLAVVQGVTLQRFAVDRYPLSVLYEPPPPTQPMVDYLISIDNVDVAQIWLDRRNEQNRLVGITPPAYPSTIRPDSDRGGWISHTRLMSDYLLSLGMVPAAELAMANGATHSGQRILNQAWFAFNVGYQANPTVIRQPDGNATIVTSGGGGDPIGAAIYEIRARAGSLENFMRIMRSITTREELFAVLDDLRQQ